MKVHHECESKTVTIVVGVVVEDSWTKTKMIIIIMQTSSAQLLWRERVTKVKARG